MSKSMLSAMKAKYKALDRDAKPSPEKVIETKASLFRKNVNDISENFETHEYVETEFGLALLFIVIDDLPHEMIWRKWLEMSECSLNRVSVWIHAKYPERIKSPWVRLHLVDYSFRPEWGSVEITKAMLELMRTAVTSSRAISNLCFASESCLPVLPLDQAIDLIRSDTSSWINWKSKANNGFAKQLQFDPLEAWFPSICVLKADQWIQLSRRHAEDVLRLVDTMKSNGMDIFEPFKKVRASDEMFFPTCLALAGHLRKVSIQASGSAIDATVGADTRKSVDEERKEVTVSAGVTHICGDFQRRRVTYCLWTEGNDKSPYTFISLGPPSPPTVSTSRSSVAQEPTEGIAKAAAEENCIFMRKVRVSEAGNWETMLMQFGISDSEGQTVPVQWRGRVLMLLEWLKEVTQALGGERSSENVSSLGDERSEEAERKIGPYTTVEIMRWVVGAIHSPLDLISRQSASHVPELQTSDCSGPLKGEYSDSDDPGIRNYSRRGTQRSRSRSREMISDRNRAQGNYGRQDFRENREDGHSYRSHVHTYPKHGHLKAADRAADNHDESRCSDDYYSLIDINCREKCSSDDQRRWGPSRSSLNGHQRYHYRVDSRKRSRSRERTL